MKVGAFRARRTPRSGVKEQPMKTRVVRDVMTKDVVSVRTYTPFRTVASTMLGHHVGALPVVSTEVSAPWEASSPARV